MRELKWNNQTQKGLSWAEGRYRCYCPANDDPNPTLILFIDKEGTIRSYCYADCSEPEVCAENVKRLAHSIIETNFESVMSVTQSIAQDLNGQLQEDGIYLCHCPAHNDPNPTLSLFIDEDGRIRFLCQAGCSDEVVRAAYINLLVQLGDDTRSMPDNDEAQTEKEVEIKISNPLFKGDRR